MEPVDDSLVPDTNAETAQEEDGTIEQELPLLCKGCQMPVTETDKFCSNCGALRVVITETYSEEGFMTEVKPLAAFYIITLVICIASNNIDALQQYKYAFWVEVALAIYTIIFAATRWDEIAPLYSFKNVKPLLILAFSCVAVIASLLISFLTDAINTSLFHQEYVYVIPYLGYKFTAVIFMFSLAVYPAVIEELGFRGYVFNVVRGIAGNNSAIIISSVAFAIIHLSVFSLFWLLPFALCVGYLRNRYETLWYGMAIHFAFNATTAVSEMIEYGVAPFNF